VGARWPCVAVAIVLLTTVTYLAGVPAAVSDQTSCSRVVATSGSDLNDGSSATPWRTVQKLADNLGPGETGCIRAGTYKENVTLSQGGTALQRTVIRSYPGEVATIEGALHVTARFSTISQLVLDGHLASGGFGVVVEADDVTFSDDNVTSGATATCFKVGSSAVRANRVMITRSRIHNCETGVLETFATNTTVLYNLIYDNVDRGVRLEPDADGGMVFRNIIDSNGEGVLLAGDSTAASSSNVIHKNVIAYSNQRWNLGSSFTSGSVGTFNHVWSNCFKAGNADTSFNPGGGIVGPSATRGFTQYDPLLVQGNPQYVNRDAGDFHLKSASPCLPYTGDIAALLDGPDTAPPDSAVPIRKPNVLVILTDDQRTEGTLEAMPKTEKWLETGGIGANGDLIAGGTYFPENIGTTPLCCPGRTSLFSGLYSHNTHIAKNCCVADVFDQGSTIQAYLGRPSAGYGRGIFGRFMNWNVWLNPPFWDRWAIAHGGNFFAPDVNEQGVRRAAAQAPREYSTTYFTDQALAFLDEQEQTDSAGWIMQVSPYAPHLPSTPDTQYDSSHYPASELPAYQQTPAQLETDLSDKPPWVQQWTDSQNVFGTSPEGSRLRQLRSLKSVDDSVDTILTKLEQTGEAADTLVFYTSDNGFMWHEHGLTNKSKPYLDSLRVPLLMRWPGNPQVRRNSVDSRLTALIDIAPTVMAATGQSPDPDKPMDGVSLLDPTNQRGRILGEYWGDLNGAPDEESLNPFAAPTAQAGPKWRVPPWATLVSHNYQYTEYYDDEGTQPTFRELYDLRNDPWELNNLYGSDGDPSNEPELSADAAVLSAQLAADRLCVGSNCSPGPGAPSPTDQTAPILLVRGPVEGATVNKNVVITLLTWDNLGVKGVRYQLDGIDIVPEMTGQPWGITWDTTTTTDGPHTLTITSRDTAGNASTSTVHVVVDNSGIDIQTANHGPTVGYPETSDTITYSFGAQMDPGSILSGWDGSPTSVTAKFNADDPLHDYNDALVMLKPDDTPIPALGTIDLGISNYVGLYEPGGRFTSSTMTMAPDGRSITVALGDPNPLLASFHADVASMIWETSSLAQKVGGQPFCSCRVWEGIPAPATAEDREF
jgi:arylsulfatase A-like enzyme